ncbi:HD domain-containing protein 2 [Trichinella murrelli]|uniref:5'-deoxynucleotidase HDDC2 n=1 Tax=Trichinella murrelli TaxID=144512 RepID=A0A0V0TLG2_9BILA|nr:HD domain-containing protein 2 [Trichinella murrelli]
MIDNNFSFPEINVSVASGHICTWTRKIYDINSDMGMEDVVEFCKLVGHLKHLPRTGWLYKGIENPETVAAHMYRMAVLTFFLQNEDLDTSRCMKMALVHDLGESIIGDITPFDNISAEEKQKREEDAMKKIASLLPAGRGEEVLQLFQEYEEGKTAVAKFVKDLDKFDMIMQAFEYEMSTSRQGQLEEFFHSSTFRTETIAEWASRVKALRNENCSHVPQSSSNSTS